MGDVRNVKQNYTASEWNNREIYYIDEMAKLVIPPNPTTKDVMRLSSEIDLLVDEALLEQIYIKRKHANYDTRMKNMEKEVFTTVKTNPSLAGAGVQASQKLTENEVKSLVIKFVKSQDVRGTKVSGPTVSIYDLVNVYLNRLFFIDGVVKMLIEKKSAMVSDNAMMKLEASSTNPEPAKN